jgi:hypothetical protein
MDGTEEYKDRAVNIIKGLRGIQESLEPHLEGIKVKVDKERSPDLQSSIEAVFGDRSGHPDDGFITFEMYRECLKIARAGGKEKASQIIKDVKV